MKVDRTNEEIMLCQFRRLPDRNHQRSTKHQRVGWVQNRWVLWTAYRIKRRSAKDINRATSTYTKWRAEVRLVLLLFFMNCIALCTYFINTVILIARIDWQGRNIECEQETEDFHGSNLKINKYKLVPQWANVKKTWNMTLNPRSCMHGN